LHATRAAAEAAIDVFADKYRGNDKAVACLTKDRDALLAFFDFPAEHWDHLRTSNPIESVFATVRHRTVRTKGAVGEDRQTHGVQTCQCRRENMAAIEGREPVAKGRLRIPTIVTTHSDRSRPPVPTDRDQCDGAVRCIF
jgi:hypothetical protein